jgi:hypothetical protein
MNQGLNTGGAGGQGKRERGGCARTRKQKVTDRAKRYRANQPGCTPKGFKPGDAQRFAEKRAIPEARKMLTRNPRSRMATKKKKKKAKARRPAKKRSTAKNKRQTRAKTKKRSTARSKSNPGKNLRAKISQMKPGSWYPTTLSGARVKVQRKGSSLIIRPAGKKRSR